jgi:formate hydrogenlyase subunit 3/multisubunit Na+/H+ antiporter MnhD subunit
VGVHATGTRSGLRIGTEQHFRWLHGIVKAVLILNLIDAVLTMVWVRFGFAEEANDLLDELVGEHAVLFVIVKLALVGMGSWLLWNRRQSPMSVVAIFGAFMTYYLLLLYHLQYASSLLGSLFGN